MKYYNTTKIDKKNATYNVVFGERSNGKTFAMLRKTVLDYVKDGSQAGYVRRWKEDITGRRASRLFAGINEACVVEKATKGEFTGVHYWAGKFYLCTYTDKGKPVYNDNDIIAFSFALSDTEHDKSASFPGIKTIVFDEFLTNKTYLVDEFVLFMNAVSTIVRKRDDVKIYMLGNTVNKYCPYFTEMGLKHILKMDQGDIDVYRYGNSKLTVAVEYCSSLQSKTHTNKYFAFDNPKLSMITGGAWELDVYPHLPYKYKPKDIMFTYFIDFNDALFQCEIVNVDDVFFTYIHAKTTEIKNPLDDMIYSLYYRPEMNYNRSIYKPINKLQERVLWFYKTDRIFYQNNDVGDAINNFLKICSKQ
jgi:hypothetical protein